MFAFSFLSVHPQGIGPTLKTSVLDIVCDTFKERYMGLWDSEKDFAEHIVDECYNLSFVIV